MKDNAPTADAKPGVSGKKIAVIGAGLLVGAVATYFIGPKFLFKVKPM